MATSPDYTILGLDPRDIKVYETLYALDKSSLRSIAKATGLNRGTVYETIKRLVELGLVTFTQTGERRSFMAADPEALVALIRERRDQLQQLEATTGTYAQKLIAAKGLPAGQHAAQFYEGDEGVAAILRDVLQTVKGLEHKSYRVISSQRASSFIYHNFKSFSRQRVKLGVSVRVVSDYPSPEKQVMAERRQLVGGSAQTLNGYIIMYGPKTALISIDEANRLTGIVFSEQGTTDMLCLIFEQLWRDAKSS